MIISIALPAVLGAIALVILSQMVYRGGKRESLAAFSEGFLIEQALRFSVRPAKNIGEVITVSFSDQDLLNLGRKNPTYLYDASPEDYAEVIRVLSSHRPRLLIINWFTGAHYINSDELYVVADSIRQSKMQEDIFLAFPLESTVLLPQWLLEDIQIKKSVDCIYEVNRFCSFFKSGWEDWMIQSLINRLWIKIDPFHLSLNLPHYYPNFLVNLPQMESIPDVSFSRVLNGTVDPASIREKIVIVGNSASQPIEFQNNKKILQRTYVPESRPRRVLSRDGLPFHRFWAGIAQMFVDKNTVAIPPKPVSTFFLILVIVVVVTVLFRAGPAAAISTFLGFSIICPLMNLVLVRSFNVYLPIFQVVYGGTLTLLSCTFGLLSLSSYRTWQSSIRMQSFKDHSDLKSNFISLVSHNLNTPVAKMRGLVDLISLKSSDTASAVPLAAVSHSIAKLQLLTRVVLTFTRMDFGEVDPMTAIRLGDLFKKFGDDHLSLCKHLGYDVTLDHESIESLESKGLQDLQLDNRALLLGFAVMIAFFGGWRQRQRRCILSCDFVITSNHEKLVQFKVTHFWRYSNWQETGVDSDHDSIDPFVTKLFEDFLSRLAARHEGEWRSLQYSEHAEVIINLKINTQS